MLMRSLAVLAALVVAAPAAQDDELDVRRRAEIRRRAAESAEARAADLEAVAERLDAIAEQSAAAARDARDRARTARRQAGEARRRANEVAAELRRVTGEVDGDGVPVPQVVTDDDSPAPVRRGPPLETHKHAAATRSADENKAIYLPRLLGEHAKLPPKDVVVKSYVFQPGRAPDMADMEIRSQYQWSINVARGNATFAGADTSKLAKTGNIDLARLLLRPNPGTDAERSMKWGIRRFNIGDVTVVDCDFVDIPKEHGVYDNISGHALYQDNTFQGLGGQAIQLAYRSMPHQQYKADNLPLTGRPTVVLDGNHAVDCGVDAGRSGFTYTFFDIGTHEFPSTIVVRDCSAVHAWPFARTGSNERVAFDDERAIRSPGGLVVTQVQHVRKGATTHAVDAFVMDNCLFDLTSGIHPVMALRGVRSIHIEDSCFIARDHRRNVVLIDDQPDRRSGTVVIENCVSPEEHRVWLQIRDRRVVPLHCPGKRITIDVKTLEVTESEMRDDPLTRLVSPLADRTVAAGIHPQPPGHVDDLGTVELRVRGESKED